MDHDALPRQPPPCKKMRSGRSERSPGTTRLEDLPREIVLDVLSRLPVTSLVRFRLVCRSWRSLSQDPLLVDEHLSLTANKGPFLVFHSDYPIRNQLGFVELSAAVEACSGITSDQERAPAVRRFSLPFQDSMPEFDVVGSCNGLLCLSDSLFREPLCVYNPFTGEFRSLPESRQYPDQEAIFGFGYSQDARRYKVIKVVYYASSTKTFSSRRRPRGIQRMQSDVQVLTLGGKSPSWRSLGKAPYQIERKQPETFLHGRLHWVTGPRRSRLARQIVSFDLEEERFQEVPKPEVGSLARGNYQLGVQRGCLSAIVYCNYGRMEIWSMKKYGVGETWAKDYNVGAYMPKGLKQNANPTMMKIWKNASGRVARVLGVLQSGEILLEYKSRALVALDPNKGKFRDVAVRGLPNWFHASVHVGSLCWID